MAKRELIANDPMETKLMSVAGTVNKVATVLMIILLVMGVVAGIVVSDIASDFGTSGFVAFLIGLIPNAVLTAVVWIAREIICTWLEYQTEMHCYARTQTEILMENFEEK